MSEAKPTPGPCWVDAHMNIISSEGLVAFPGCTAGFDQKKNANLIAEAFNVQLTTGLTPSQLVERVRELEELLGHVQAAAIDQRGADFNLSPDWWAKFHTVMSKARPNTAEGEAHGQAPAVATVAAIDTYGVFPEWLPGSSKFKDWCAKYFSGDADETYLAEAVLHLPRASEGPLKAADEFELRRLLAEERATTRRLVRALAEATEPPTFMGEPVTQPHPTAQPTQAAAKEPSP